MWNSIVSHLTGNRITACCFPGGSMLFFDHKKSRFITPDSSSRIRLLLDPVRSEYLLCSVSSMPQSRKDQLAYFKWMVSSELYLKDPVVDWTVSGSEVLVFASERETLEKSCREAELKNLKVTAVDGLFSLILNQQLKNDEKTLVVLNSDQTMIAGISGEKLVFLRKLQKNAEIEEETGMTLSYYNFNPLKKIVYSYSESEPSTDLNRESVWAGLCHE